VVALVVWPAASDANARTQSHPNTAERRIMAITSGLRNVRACPEHPQGPALSTVEGPAAAYCCGRVVVGFLVRSWLSTVYSMYGSYISSQLCSDQNTSFSGAGLYLFLVELS